MRPDFMKSSPASLRLSMTTEIIFPSASETIAATRRVIEGCSLSVSHVRAMMAWGDGQDGVSGSWALERQRAAAKYDGPPLHAVAWRFHEIWATSGELQSSPLPSASHQWTTSPPRLLSGGLNAMRGHPRAEVKLQQWTALTTLPLSAS